MAVMVVVNGSISITRPMKKLTRLVIMRTLLSGFPRWCLTNDSITWFAFHLSDLAGPTSEFFNGTHEFSGLVLARMSLLMDQSRSVLPLRSAKAREFGELWREKYTRAPLTFPFKLASTSSFRLVRTDKWKSGLNLFNCIYT